MIKVAGVQNREITVYRDWESYKSRIIGSNWVGLDLETTSLHFTSGDIAVISVYEAGSDSVLVLQSSGYDCPELFEWLDSKDIVTQNGTNFDLPFLRSVGWWPKNRHHDTVIGEQVLNTTDRKNVKNNLGAIMQRRLGRSTKQSIDHGNWHVVPLTREQVEYAAHDVVALPALRDVQMRLASERSLYDGMLFEGKVSHVTAEMHYNGVPVDVFALDDALAAEEAKARKVMDMVGNVNVNSSQQVRQAFESIGIKLPNTKKETLQDVIVTAREMDEPNSIGAQFAQAVITTRASNKRTGMYDEDFVDNNIAYNGRVYGTFWQCGTAALRYSSSDPNMQQIPRDLRHVFGQLPGCKVITADYSQIELFVLADLANDEVMQRDLREVDFHTQAAATGFDKTYEEVDKDSKTRRNGKAVTFTWTFVGGPKAVVDNAMKYAIRLPFRTAVRALDNYAKRYKGVTAFQNWARSTAAQGGAANVKLPMGHRRTLVGYNLKPSTLVNTAVQGTAAMIIKNAMLKLRERDLTKYLCMQVHDELVFMGVPESEAKELGAKIRQAMIDGAADILTIPVDVDVDIEDTWVE